MRELKLQKKTLKTGSLAFKICHGYEDWIV